MNKRKLGIAIIGLGGAVGTTIVAGIELLKKGVIGKDGLPLAELPTNLVNKLVDYKNIVFGGWDLFGENLAKAAITHDVLTLKQFSAVEEELKKITPWQAVGNKLFLENIEGENQFSPENSHRQIIEKIRQDLREFKNVCDQAVVINLASTENLLKKAMRFLIQSKVLKRLWMKITLKFRLPCSMRMLRSLKMCLTEISRRPFQLIFLH